MCVLYRVSFYRCTRDAYHEGVAAACGSWCGEQRRGGMGVAPRPHPARRRPAHHHHGRAIHGDPSAGSLRQYVSLLEDGMAYAPAGCMGVGSRCQGRMLATTPTNINRVPRRPPYRAQRAWIDTKYWNNASDAPVFLSMGGEGEQGPPGGQQAVRIVKQIPEGCQHSPPNPMIWNLGRT